MLSHFSEGTSDFGPGINPSTPKFWGAIAWFSWKFTFHCLPRSASPCQLALLIPKCTFLALMVLLELPHTRNAFLLTCSSLASHLCVQWSHPLRHFPLRLSALLLFPAESSLFPQCLRGPICLRPPRLKCPDLVGTHPSASWFEKRWPLPKCSPLYSHTLRHCP